jgi:uncharacterized protein YfaQ (DUF2300 family)
LTPQPPDERNGHGTDVYTDAQHQASHSGLAGDLRDGRKLGIGTAETLRKWVRQAEAGLTLRLDPVGRGRTLHQFGAAQRPLSPARPG